MGVHYGNRPTGNDRMVPKLLNHYYGSDAAAAYSLRNLDYLKRNDPVVRVRRASDNEEQDFTAAEVLADLETWANSGDPTAPTGGTISVITDPNDGKQYRVHTFTSDGTFETPVDLEVEYLIVGGGGSGGGPNFNNPEGGGGGAGGLIQSSITVGADSFAITVGAGAPRNIAPTRTLSSQGENGENSIAFGFTALGGGGGGARFASPISGGSGGGAGGYSDSTNTGAAGTSGQGNNGGNALTSPQNGGGGGGAGAAGQNAADSPASEGGDGGIGLDFSSLFGANVGENGYFAGGGGGGTSGSGGLGGGGDAAINDCALTTSNNICINGGQTPEDGLPNTGGGGGGGARQSTDNACGGAGGSGIVIIRYELGNVNADAFVTTWYDQSGNDSHATQTTATNQPKIVDAGTLLSSFDVSDNNVYLEVPSITSTGTLITSTDSGTYDVQVNLSGGSHKIYTYHIWAIEQLLYYDRVIPNDEYDKILDRLQNNGFTIQQNFGTDWSNAFRNRPEIVSTANINIPAATSYESIFDGCTSLESAPQLDFSNVTRLNNSFRNSNAGAWLTASFFDETASGITQIAGFGGVFGRNGAFSNNPTITEIPTGFLDNCTGLISAAAGFENCNNLSSIPSNLFDNCPLITEFGGRYFVGFFENCGLTSIPAGLFDNNPNVINFGGTFGGNSITSIPAGLFDNNPNVTNFQGTFGGNSITSIPAGLFDNNPNVTSFYRTFYRNSITSIPAGLFDNNPNVISFRGTFDGNSITSIPAGLFDNNPNVTSFELTFFLNSITSIPAGLFDNNPNVTNFGGTFFRNSITSIPAGLFDNQTQCTNYNGVFRRNSLDQTSVDNVLVSVQTSADANNLNDGTLGIHEGTNATPSATGQAAADALRARGWTVTLNGY